jgi:hypothetical protein
MSRGKNQASQNAKKLALAEERITHLEREAAANAAQAHEAQQQLISKIQSLRNRLVSDVGVLAAEKIAAARREAEQSVKAFELAHEEAVIKAFKYLNENGEVRASLEGWGEVASILGVHAGTLIASVSNENHNRLTRRANRSHINAIAKQRDWNGA